MNILRVVKVVVIDIVGCFNGFFLIYVNFDLRIRVLKIRDIVGICILIVILERK